MLPLKMPKQHPGVHRRYGQEISDSCHGFFLSKPYIFLTKNSEVSLQEDIKEESLSASPIYGMQQTTVHFKLSFSSFQMNTHATTNKRSEAKTLSTLLPLSSQQLLFHQHFMSNLHVQNPVVE